MSSAQPTQVECKWCGETFAAGTATCPQCGRPVPPQSGLLSGPTAAPVYPGPLPAAVRRPAVPQSASFAWGYLFAALTFLAAGVALFVSLVALATPVAVYGVIGIVCAGVAAAGMALLLLRKRLGLYCAYGVCGFWVLAGLRSLVRLLSVPGALDNPSYSLGVVTGSALQLGLAIAYFIYFLKRQEWFRA